MKEILIWACRQVEDSILEGIANHLVVLEASLHTDLLEDLANNKNLVASQKNLLHSQPILMEANLGWVRILTIKTSMNRNLLFQMHQLGTAHLSLKRKIILKRIFKKPKTL